ncbi:MAG: hypothetical protein DDT42_02099 [candidate division WS2 bacterium]|uniref:Uncharacterized protein n=1 Tax=Psychracetigena formicireducens TaxID=2986056 RepID=A0A9E2F2W0_PSYF1|nr:hypothetical protein [Candidatus Psychracetigena formicireducens]
MKKFKEVTAQNNEFFGFYEVGDSVEGVLSEPIEIQGKYGKMILYEVDGEDVQTIVTTAVLESKLPPLVGEYVKITFTGLKDNKNKTNTYKNFKIEVLEQKDEVPF